MFLHFITFYLADVSASSILIKSRGGEGVCVLQLIFLRIPPSVSSFVHVIASLKSRGLSWIPRRSVCLWPGPLYALKTNPLIFPVGYI